MSKNFTVFLVLKDRPGYTYRFMRYMDYLRYPFDIIIADGGKNKEIEGILLDKSNFPNIQYDYLRHPYDETLDDFHQKMADSITKISTPLASIMDNDDFLILDGVSKCVQVLAESNKYSSARGAIHRMHVSHNISGYMQLGDNMYSRYLESIEGDTAMSRVYEQSARFHGNWHNVARSNHLKAAWNMINIVKPQNMRFTEQMTGYLNAVWGDGFRGEFPWLLHQHGERIEVQGGNLDSHYPDQKSWINSDFWPEEFAKMTEVIGTAISSYDGCSIEDAMKAFREAYIFKLPEMKDLLQSRINESYEVGYNDGRIKKLFDVVEKYNVKAIEAIGNVDYDFPEYDEELIYMRNFLMTISPHKR